MKVKMLTAIAGVDFSVLPGETTDRFSAKEAARLVKAGQAIPVVADKTERAVKQVPKAEQR